MARSTPKFDRKARILAPNPGRDSDGGPRTGYVATMERWCHRLDLSSREYRLAAALRSETTALFTFRYFAGLSPQHRIECEGRVYDVFPPKEIGRRQYLEVEAKERIGQ